MVGAGLVIDVLMVGTAGKRSNRRMVVKCLVVVEEDYYALECGRYCKKLRVGRTGSRKSMVRSCRGRHANAASLLARPYVSWSIQALGNAR